ncbi:PadR family transcriptional regulator [Dactylosporangium sp. NPDC005555]|uniref:PadR family transcriptional regulator n=1 Tax=Dactylosporangium sp. NPDC005555 TaxID=3154889 RepID=UPI0033A85B7D
MLLAVADVPRHGYAIMQTIAAESDGAVQLGPTTLYRTLRTLFDHGLIQASSNVDDVSDDPRRRYYRITEAGRNAARVELARLESVLRRAHGKLRMRPDTT